MPNNQQLYFENEQADTVQAENGSTNDEGKIEYDDTEYDDADFVDDTEYRNFQYFVSPQQHSGYPSLLCYCWYCLQHLSE